jgi:hypothetical protein
MRLKRCFCSLAISIPPLSLQEEFAGVVARVESLPLTSFGDDVRGGWLNPSGRWRGCLNLYYMRRSMGRGDPSMPTMNPSGWKTLADENRVSPGRVAPTVAFADVVMREKLGV